MGQVTTRRRGDKWEYRFEGVSVGGKRKQISKGGFLTRKEAYTAGVKAHDLFVNGASISGGEIALADYINDIYIPHLAKVVRPSSYKNECSQFRKITSSSLGGYPLKSLTPLLLNTWFETLISGGMSLATAKAVKSCFSGALSYAVYPCQFIAINPLAHVKLKASVGAKEKKFLTLDEINGLFALPASPCRLAVIIAYYTGLRLGEVLALEWDDVDFGLGCLSVKRTEKQSVPMEGGGHTYLAEPKTATSRRTVFFGEKLKQELLTERKRQEWDKREYEEFYQTLVLVPDKVKGMDVEVKKIETKPLGEAKRGDEIFNPICRTNSGGALTANTVTRWCHKAGEELGFEFHFHMLRHTHTTLLLESGAPIKAVQERLGHSSVNTTLAVYSHVTDDVRKDLAKILG